MKKELKKKDIQKNIFLIPIRYLILLILMFSLPLIYKIFTPLTIYPLFFLLKIFFKEVILQSNILIINSTKFIEIIPACVAGSAYLLLLILNLSVPMSSKKRIYSIVLSFLILLFLNIFRLFFLAILYEKETIFFDLAHKIFWYGLSTIFVVIIWFLTTKIFSIKEIPVYSDLKLLIKNIK